jgi:hypothetical protein
MVSENAKRIEIDLDRFHFFVVKHEKQFFIPTNEGLRLINVNIDWISALGDAPFPPKRLKRSLTDVPLRSLRMPLPTSAHPSLTPLHKTTLVLSRVPSFQNG